MIGLLSYKYKYKYKIKTYNAPYVTRVIRRRGQSGVKIRHFSTIQKNEKYGK